jgi:hypothetical protein
MKTAWEGKPKSLDSSMRVGGMGSGFENTSSSIAWGWKQEKLRPSGECFLLTSPSIERFYDSFPRMTDQVVDEVDDRKSGHIPFDVASYRILKSA